MRELRLVINRLKSYVNHGWRKIMKKSLLAIFICVGIFLSACGQAGVSSPQPDIMTAAALTVQAALATKPISSPTTITSTSVPLASPTSSNPPVLSVGEVTDCRSGPSPDYERVTQLQPGQEIQITGFYPPNYWVVNFQEGTCWIEVNFATPQAVTKPCLLSLRRRRPLEM